MVDALDAVAKETGKTVPQVALNWLLQRPTVATVIIGARNEEQLRQNLGAVGWNLTPEQVARLDAASAVTLAYPYWHQRGFAERNPPPVLSSDRRHPRLLSLFVYEHVLPRKAAVQKKLTITLDERVYEGLHAIVGRRRISGFIESLVRPRVIDKDLDIAYAQYGP